MSHTDTTNSIWVKFINHEFASRVMDGILYCNCMNYFRNLPNHGGQGDSSEGIAYYYPDFNDKSKTQRIELDGETNYLYCLFNLAPSYILPNDEGHYQLTAEAKKRFEYFNGNKSDMDCIVIFTPDKFITRIYETVSSNYHAAQMMHSACEYVLNKKEPNERNNELLKREPYKAAFFKSKEFEWQEEYRILLYNV